MGGYRQFAPPASYFGDHVLTVAPAGQGTMFDSIQAAIDWAEANIPDDEPVGILLAPSDYYDEDVILRRNHTHFNGLAGGLGGIVVKSMTLSDCTLASIAAFNLNGDPTALVEDTTGTRRNGAPVTDLYDAGAPASVTLTPLAGMNNIKVALTPVGVPESLVQIGPGQWELQFQTGVSTPTSLQALVAGDPVAVLQFAVSGDQPLVVFPGGYAGGAWNLYTGTKPETISFTNIRFGRRTNSPAWFTGTDGVWDPSTSKYNHDSALYSFRALGAPVPGNTFLSDVCAFIGCVTDTAGGAVPNAPNGFYFCYASNPVFLNSLGGDGIQTHNCTSCLMIHATSFSPMVSFFDTTEAQPWAEPGGGFGGFATLGSELMGGLYAIGPDGANGMQIATTIMNEWKTEATSAVGTTWINTALFGALEITNVGPALTALLSRYAFPCGGAGAAGFTEFVGFGT